MRRLLSVFLCLVCWGVFFGCASQVKIIPVATISGEAQPIVETELSKSKMTDLGLYITSKEAYEQWKLHPEKIKIIDCRTPEEYAFVGHAPMAYNIPGKFYTYQFDAEKKAPIMIDNNDFSEEVMDRFQIDDTIYIMCRSGGRSANSVNILAKAGFKKVYNIIDGFEGDKVKDPGSFYNGKRMRNGWKNSGAPWTYSLDPALMYLKEK